MSPLHREYATSSHSVWKEIAPHITPQEFNEPWQMDVEALRKLYRVRVRSGIPFRFISDARTPEMGVGAQKSAHNERPCTAVDLHVASSRERFKIMQAAIQEGYVRIGIYPAKYGGSGTVHLDLSVENPQEVCWTRY